LRISVSIQLPPTSLPYQIASPLQAFSFSIINVKFCSIKRLSCGYFYRLEIRG